MVLCTWYLTSSVIRKSHHTILSYLEIISSGVFFLTAHIYNNRQWLGHILRGGSTSWVHLRLSSLPPDSEELGFVQTWNWSDSRCVWLLSLAPHPQPPPSTLPLKMIRAGFITAQLCDLFILPDPQPLDYSNCKHIPLHYGPTQANRRQEKENKKT